MGGTPIRRPPRALVVTFLRRGLEGVAFATGRGSVDETGHAVTLPQDSEVPAAYLPAPIPLHQPIPSLQQPQDHGAG